MVIKCEHRFIVRPQLSQHKSSPLPNSFFSSGISDDFSCQSSFNFLCMYRIADFFSLSVLAFRTLNFSLFLVFIWWDVLFSGNRRLNFEWCDDLFAKVMQSCSLLFSKVGKSRISKAFSYDLNFSFKIIFRAVFCTLNEDQYRKMIINIAI